MAQQSMPWRELRAVVMAAPVQDEDVREARDLLEAWDGVLGVDSPAATLFEMFVGEMATRVAQSKAPRSAAWVLGKGFGSLVPGTMFSVRRVGHLVRLLRVQPEGWFSRPWMEEVSDSLASAIRAIRERFGEDTRRWAWGHVRPLTLRHPLGHRALLRPIFNRGPYPWGGDSNTVSQAANSAMDPLAEPRIVASLRMVVDVGNWEAARFSLPGGQSGNPLSPHYDDLIPLWRRGEGVPIAWAPAEVRRVARDTLRLLPVSA